MLDKKELVSNELNVLDGTMTYAEEQINYVPNIGNMTPGTEKKLINISEQQKAAYREYLIHAYGKAIRIESELQGEIIFRISQSAAIFTNRDYQIATPNSLIGRLVSIARVGQEYESKILGEYTILDVWEFDRYRGTDVVIQRRNFASMTAKGTLNFYLTNLKKWLSEASKQEGAEQDIEKLEEDILDIYQWIIKEEPTSAETPPTLPEPQSIGLNARFYINLNEKQFDAAHLGKKGLAVVEGVAGSGKTSVALSRTKSLMQ